MASAAQDGPDRNEGLYERLAACWARGGVPNLRQDVLDPAARLPPDERIDVFLLDLRERWRQGHHHVRAEVYLKPPEGDGLTTEAVFSIILLERKMRREAGEEVSAEDYLRRFPRYGSQLTDQLALEEMVDPEGPSGLPDSEEPPVPERYEVRKELGEGGFSRVYDAYDSKLKRNVALKVGTKAWGKEATDRFRREAVLIARIKHGNVVPIYDVGKRNGFLYISMELMGGGSLRKLVPSLVENPAAAARLLAAVARGVHACHQCLVLHRDLKPENILLDAQGVPHVSDFGLAKPVQEGEHLTNTSVTMGTVGYMSPEQIRDAKTCTTASDVYGLGAVLYELLTGRTPFVGTKHDVMMQALEVDRPPDPRSVKDGVDPDLAAIALQCLEREPGRRYLSAAALADDLERWLRGEPVSARQIGRAERIWRLAKRRPWAASAAAALAIAVTLALVAGGLAGYFWKQESAARGAAETAETTERRARIEAEEALYRRGVMQAFFGIRDNHNEDARLSLQDCPVRCRNWEWRFADASLRGGEVTAQDTGPILGVAFTPDENQVVSVTSTGTASFWGSHDGKLHSRVVLQGAAPRPEELMQEHSVAYALGPSPRVAIVSVLSTPLGVDVGSETFLKVWDLKTGVRVFSTSAPHRRGKTYSRFPPVALSHDGARVAWAPDAARVTVLEIASGKSQFSTELKREDKQDLRVFRLAFSPDGRSLAAASCLADHRSPGDNALPGNPGLLPGKELDEVASDCVHILDASSGKVRGRQSRSTEWLMAADWDSLSESSGLGRRCLSAILSWNGRMATSRRGSSQIDLALLSRSIMNGLGDDFMPTDSACAVHAPSRLLARALHNDSTVRVCQMNNVRGNLAGGNPPELTVAVLRGHASLVTCLAFSKAGRALATADVEGKIMVWSDQSWQTPALTEMYLGNTNPTSSYLGGGPLGLRFFGLTSPIHGCAISGDRARVAIKYFDPPALVIFEPRVGRVVRSDELTAATEFGEGLGLALSNDGRSVATADVFGTVRARDTTSGKVVWQSDFLEDKNWKPDEAMPDKILLKAPLISLRYSPDGKSVVAASGNKVHYFDAATGGLTYSCDLSPPPGLRSDEPAPGRITNLSFSPDGRHLACVFDGNGPIAIATPDARDIRRWIRGNALLGFDASGTIMAAAKGLDVEILKVEDGSRITSFRCRSFGRRGAFSPDGTRFVIGGIDGSLSIWEIPTGNNLATYMTNVQEQAIIEVEFIDESGRLLAVTSDGWIQVFDAARP